MDRSKAGTARIALFQQLKTPFTYTIETSQFGTEEGHLSLKVFDDIAKSIAKSLILLFKVETQQSQSQDSIEFEK